MKIRELLTDESKWTKGATAKNKFGVITQAQDPEAICWCLFGAYIKCYSPDDPQRDAVSEKLSGVVHERFCWFISQWNDDPERTFAEVKALVEELDV